MCGDGNEESRIGEYGNGKRIDAELKQKLMRMHLQKQKLMQRLVQVWFVWRKQVWRGKGRKRSIGRSGWMHTRRLKLQRIGRKNYPTRKFTHSAEARESESFLQSLKTKPFRQPTAWRRWSAEKINSSQSPLTAGRGANKNTTVTLYIVSFDGWILGLMISRWICPFSCGSRKAKRVCAWRAVVEIRRGLNK
jgi:hypothetical protein